MDVDAVAARVGKNRLDDGAARSHNPKQSLSRRAAEGHENDARAACSADVDVRARGWEGDAGRAELEARRPSPAVSRIVAWPLPSGSPGPGASAAPVSVAVSAVPPWVGDMGNAGQPAGGRRTSPVWRAWAFRADFETLMSTYGFVFEPVRWQIVTFSFFLRCRAACASVPDRCPRARAR